MNPYDVIVIGAGHAGCEAALAAARMGSRTALVTMEREAVGRLSCNPSIGGMAKSHIVFEIDALGGEMARNTDYTGIQFRVLNTSKGPAVRANRVQCDKEAYPARMLAVLGVTPGLDLIEGTAGELWVENGRLRGVIMEDASAVEGKAVVLATGTFLRGKCYIGKKEIVGGRMGEKSAVRLSESIRALGFRMARLKTGTPPRLHKDSVDYGVMDRQPGLEPPPFFSSAAKREMAMFHVEQPGLNNAGSAEYPGADNPDPEVRSGALFHVEHTDSRLRPWPLGKDQMCCFLTHTTAKTHEIIENNLKESALYGGMIEGTGVRYCPSIEDKVVKFRSQAKHHVFVEPEGRNLPEVYPNGTSNSLPEDIQVEMIRSIPGFERAEFIRPGYAIEYDFVDPTELSHNLETKRLENLFFAGQINGTTGYEEAAGQGFAAGVNAVLKVRGEKPLVLSRNEAYIGVLIDDLVTKGTNEPYRMFTSRAEHRLILRQDNAAFRLLSASRRIGIVPGSILEEVDRMARETEAEIARLEQTFANGGSLAQALRRPQATYAGLAGRRNDLCPEVAEQVEVCIKYAGYIERERKQIAKSEKFERQIIPDWIDYGSIKALRFEARQKLTEIRPENLGQASRISGVTPADIAILTVWIHRGRAGTGNDR